MIRHILRITSILIFAIATFSVGHLSARSDSSSRLSPKRVFDAAYRSHSSTHKVIVQATEPALHDSILAAGGSVLEDYGAFALMQAPNDAAEQVALESISGSSVRDDMNALLLRTGAFDTTEGEPVTADAVGDSDTASKQLWLVQFIGPIKKQWLKQLSSVADIVCYIPNNAYLVRTNSEGRPGLDLIKSDEKNVVQWIGAFKPGYKIAPEISLSSEKEIDATVQLLSNDETNQDIQDLAARSSALILDEPKSVLQYTNIRIRVQPRMLPDIARMNNVVWIEPRNTPVLHDEKQDLIVAGMLTDTQIPAATYLTWLQSKGISSTPDFIVDVADTGIDRGLLDPQILHADFLNAAGAARVAYARYVGANDIDATPLDTAGHGTVNASIVGGYNAASAFPHADSDGFRYGLGVHPYVKLGVTQVFAPDYTNPPLAKMVDMMYRDGARISSNSWGSNDNSYTADCQTYDSLVRDSQASVPSNQEMTIVFSAGNSGPGGHLSSPGNAKNVITVGASENLRPGMDGCKIDSSGADDMNSLISFSSGGPSTDGRLKPDIVAPGTHVTGARSQASGYTGSGVCGPDYPAGQSYYTWSSGTSHSCPAVAGGAAIVRQFFQQSAGHAPSPAMIKAYLTNSASYMTGALTDDTLPSNNQGWGLMSLARALDGVPRMMIDQDQVLSNTGQIITLHGRVADPSKHFRVTLAWTDAPGNLVASPVVNDLDLQVDIGGRTYLGNHFSGAVSVEGGPADHLDNLEGVWAPQGSSGDFTVRIVAANITGDGVPGNSDLTDQDFALVVYNAQSPTSGGSGPVDLPPTVTLTAPVGGESFIVGSTVRIQWTASDDKGIQSQKVEFSSDNITFNPIAELDSKARTFDWKVPGLPTSGGRIRVSASDGVNLPATATNASPFQIVNGPPDTTPPTLTLLSHNGTDPVGGGTTSSIKWNESDNVGVIRRVIEVSLDNGNTYQQIASLTAPANGDSQSFDWQVAVDMGSGRAKVRVTVFDGAGNSAVATSKSSFEIWPMPIINDATFTEGDKPVFELAGRNFRFGETEIWVDGTPLRKIQFDDRYFTGNTTYKHIASIDKKLSKRVPDRTWVKIDVRLPKTGQISPVFSFRRKKPLA